MAEAVLLNSFRQRIAAHMAGKGTLAPIGYMAFGDGGHNDDLTAKPALPEATGLANELLRKPIDVITQEDPFSVTGKGSVDMNELVGVALSEAALIDTDGNVIGIKNFSPKVKESDESYDVSIKLRF